MVNVLELRSFASSGRPFDDWMVDGQPLSVWMAQWAPAGAPSPGGGNWIVTRDPIDLRALLDSCDGPGGPASRLESGRVPIYVCADCGDLGCGTFTVRVGLRDEGGLQVVTWADYAWETDYSPLIGPQKELAPVPALKFDAIAYSSVVRQMLG